MYSLDERQYSMIIFYLGIKEKAVLHQEIKHKYSIKNHMKKDSIFKFYFDYKIELLINILYLFFLNSLI